jgi:hypothetical protein
VTVRSNGNNTGEDDLGCMVERGALLIKVVGAAVSFTVGFDVG